MFFLHLFFRCFHFSTVWSDLRAAVPQGSDVLHYLASSLPDVALASRTPSASSKYFSSYKRCKSRAREHGFTAFPASPFHFAIYLQGSSTIQVSQLPCSQGLVAYKTLLSVVLYFNVFRLQSPRALWRKRSKFLQTYTQVALFAANRH